MSVIVNVGDLDIDVHLIEVGFCKDGLVLGCNHALLEDLRKKYTPEQFSKLIHVMEVYFNAILKDLKKAN